MKANVYTEGQAANGSQPNIFGKSTPQRAKTPAREASATWLVPAALIMLVIIPLAAGTFRLTQYATFVWVRIGCSKNAKPYPGKSA